MLDGQVRFSRFDGVHPTHAIRPNSPCPVPRALALGPHGGQHRPSYVYAPRIPFPLRIPSTTQWPSSAPRVPLSGRPTHPEYHSPYAPRWPCSDGDGQTNGHELGDPCCVFIRGAVPERQLDISHPGDGNSRTAAPPCASATALPAVRNSTGKPSIPGAPPARSAAPSASAAELAPSGRATLAPRLLTVATSPPPVPAAPAPAGCADADVRCGAWATVGECVGASSIWMGLNCPRSCGGCRSGIATPEFPSLPPAASRPRTYACDGQTCAMSSDPGGASTPVDPAQCGGCPGPSTATTRPQYTYSCQGALCMMSSGTTVQARTHAPTCAAHARMHAHTQMHTRARARTRTRTHHRRNHKHKRTRACAGGRPCSLRHGRLQR